VAHVLRGLDGVVAATSGVTQITDERLFYRGIAVEDLFAHSTHEEVIFLLWEGRLPTEEELAVFQKRLAEEAHVPAEITDFLVRLPRTAPPMALLRALVDAASLLDGDAEKRTLEARRTVAFRLVARMPLFAAAIGRYRAGKGLGTTTGDIAGDGKLARAFLRSFRGEEPEEADVRILDRTFLLHADHELNASTFVARSVASTLSDMYSAIVAAIGALKGPLHGGANEGVMTMLEEIGPGGDWMRYVADKLARKERIMGFGHRVYKHGDPRTDLLRSLAREALARRGGVEWLELAECIEAYMAEVKGLKPNVDYYAALVYRGLGIPKEMYPLMFAIARTAGWTTHLFEQYADNRLIRPRAVYVGPVAVPYTPIEQRNCERR